MQENIDDVLSGSAGFTRIYEVVCGKGSRRQVRDAIHRLVTDGSYPGHMRLTRVKYKPGRKLSAYFLVPFIRTEDVYKARPVAISWKRSGQDQENPPEGAVMEAEIQSRQLSKSFRRLWQTLPDQNARLMIWPYDPAFSQLPRLSDPNYVQSLEGLQGSNTHWKVFPIRYRPGERHVLRYEANTSSRASQGGVYAKLYQDPIEAGRASRVAKRVVDWLAGNARQVGGVRPLSCSEVDGFVLYPHAPGTPVSHLLGKLTPDLLDLLKQVGKALRVLHEGPRELAGELEEHNINQEIRATARASEHIQVLLPETGKLIDELLDWTGKMSERQPGGQATFTHSDFKADHLLISPLGVTVIDFDTCALAEPAIDPGKFLADLEWWFALKGWPGLEHAQAAFLEGYGADTTPEQLARIRLYQALVLIKITARRAKLSDAFWPEQVSRSIARAREILRQLAIELGEPVL